MKLLLSSSLIILGLSRVVKAANSIIEDNESNPTNIASTPSVPQPITLSSPTPKPPLIILDNQHQEIEQKTFQSQQKNQPSNSRSGWFFGLFGGGNSGPQVEPQVQSTKTQQQTQPPSPTPSTSSNNSEAFMNIELTDTTEGQHIAVSEVLSNSPRTSSPERASLPPITDQIPSPVLKSQVEGEQSLSILEKRPLSPKKSAPSSPINKPTSRPISPRQPQSSLPINFGLDSSSATLLGLDGQSQLTLPQTEAEESTNLLETSPLPSLNLMVEEPSQDHTNVADENNSVIESTTVSAAVCDKNGECAMLGVTISADENGNNFEMKITAVNSEHGPTVEDVVGQVLETVVQEVLPAIESSLSSSPKRRNSLTEQLEDARHINIPILHLDPIQHSEDNGENVNDQPLSQPLSLIQSPKSANNKQKSSSRPQSPRPISILADDTIVVCNEDSCGLVPVNDTLNSPPIPPSPFDDRQPSPSLPPAPSFDAPINNEPEEEESDSLKAQDPVSEIYNSDSFWFDSQSDEWKPLIKEAEKQNNTPLVTFSGQLVDELKQMESGWQPRNDYQGFDLESFNLDSFTKAAPKRPISPPIIVSDETNKDMSLLIDFFSTPVQKDSKQAIETHEAMQEKTKTAKKAKRKQKKRRVVKKKKRLSRNKGQIDEKADNVTDFAPLITRQTPVLEIPESNMFLSEVQPEPSSVIEDFVFEKDDNHLFSSESAPIPSPIADLLNPMKIASPKQIKQFELSTNSMSGQEENVSNLNILPQFDQMPQKTFFKQNLMPIELSTNSEHVRFRDATVEENEDEEASQSEYHNNHQKAPVFFKSANTFDEETNEEDIEEVEEQPLYVTKAKPFERSSSVPEETEDLRPIFSPNEYKPLPRGGSAFSFSPKSINYKRNFPTLTASKNMLPVEQRIKKLEEKITREALYGTGSNKRSARRQRKLQQQKKQRSTDDDDDDGRQDGTYDNLNPDLSTHPMRELEDDSDKVQERRFFTF